MKMIKNILLAFSALALAFMSAACSDINSPKEASQNSAGKAIVVNGSLSAGSGRSAISSYTSDTITWNVTACPMTESGSPNTDNIVEATVNEDMSFSITFTKEGDYLFFAKGTIDGKSVLVGNANANIKDGTNTVTITVSSPFEVETGKISLAFTDATQDSQLATLSVYENAELVSTANFTDKNALFEMAESTAGLHIYKFCFDDQAGNTIYTCREAVTVFGGLTTDTWQGKSPYFVQDEDGSVRFEINDDLITGYDAERVPNTKIVLYGPTGEYGNLSYYLVDSSTETITDDTPATVETDLSGTSFVFDSKGYFYTFAKLTESAIFIKSTKPDFGSKTHDNTYYPGAMYLDVNYGSCMTIDRVNDFLYFLDTGSGAIFQITGDDGEYIFKSSNAYDSAKNYSFTNDTNRNIIQSANTFAIYDRVAYFGSFNYADSSLHLVIADLKKAEPGDSDTNYLVDGSKDIDLGASEMGLSSNARFVDMLYQDGCIYMLVKEYSDSPIGALIRYNIITGAVDSLGLADDVDKSTLAGTKLSGCCKDSDSDLTRLYEDEDLTSPWYINANKEWGDDYKLLDYLNIRAPNFLSQELSENEFYGPSKFIAVKPKKLVIADDGIAFYTENDALMFKNVNRVVTVDLDTFKITTDNVDLSFAEEKTTPIQVLDCTSYTPYQGVALDESGEFTPKYYAGGTVGGADRVLIGIPCGD